MVWLFLPVFAFAVIALLVGVRRFWRAADIGAPPRAARFEALRNVARLTYLDGGHGDGCNEEDDRFTLARRRWHHLVFYGFLLCFGATCVATVYHYGFDWRAPYRWFSLPKLLGITGGIAMMAGCIGLMLLNFRRDPAHGDPAQHPLDRGFIALLFLTAASGLVLMLFRDGRALGLLLAVHLATVMALFLTLPYGKFAHGVYRAAALIKWAIERRRPNPLGLAED
jgi:citrate/tricarballylate utilization protein